MSTEAAEVKCVGISSRFREHDGADRLVVPCGDANVTRDIRVRVMASMRGAIRTHLLSLALCLAMLSAESIRSLLVATPALAAEESSKLSAELLNALEFSAGVPVLVVLREPVDTHSGSRRREYLQRSRSVRESVLRDVAPIEFRVTYEMDSIAVMSGMVTPSGARRLAANPSVERLDVDRGGAAHLLETLPLVGLLPLQQSGLTGNGVTVAVLDSGIDGNHRDLAESIVAEQCFCMDVDRGCCPNGEAEQEGPGSARDDNGHGTHVAGIVTSDGGIAPIGGAPKAGIVAVRVLNEQAVFSTSAQVIAGLDWILKERDDVRVVNLSLGTTALFAGDCGTPRTPNATTIALARAVDALTLENVVVIASSGNNCSGIRMAAPACIADVISVAATYDANLGPRAYSLFRCQDPATLGCSDSDTAPNQTTCFSNRNETTDVFAPGAHITSTGRGGSTAGFSGTSQAAPIVAACAAVLLEAAPTLRSEQVGALLRGPSGGVSGSAASRGAPLLDCLASLREIGWMPPTATRGGVTVTPTATEAPSPSMSRTHTSTASPTIATPHVGDCDRDGNVIISELVLVVRIALDRGSIELCRSGDANADGIVEISEVVRAVRNALAIAQSRVYG